jgi:hypothetical protein
MKNRKKYLKIVIAGMVSFLFAFIFIEIYISNFYAYTYSSYTSIYNDFDAGLILFWIFGILGFILEFTGAFINLSNKEGNDLTNNTKTVASTENSIQKIIENLLKDSKKYVQTSKNYPNSYREKIQFAVKLKRKEKYLKAVEVYIDLINKSGTIYSGLLSFLYKVVASAGYLKEGKELLLLGKSICDKRSNQFSLMFEEKSNFDDHLDRLNDAINDEKSLIIYLSSISGNHHYSLPRNYSTILSEYKNV